MEDMKIVKSLEEFGLLIKVANETIENEGKEQKDKFLGMLLTTLGSSLLENMLPGKGVIKVFDEIICAGEQTIRVGQDF